jgi:hypothetical protein
MNKCEFCKKVIKKNEKFLTRQFYSIDKNKEYAHSECYWNIQLGVDV